MYVFYGDESGFSKGNTLEANQPITVYAGIVVDVTKLNKAVAIYKSLLKEINEECGSELRELKFSDFKQCNKEPYKSHYSDVGRRCDLLERVVRTFCNEIKFKLLYTAVDDKTFFGMKDAGDEIAKDFKHPFVAACYRVISRIEHLHKGKDRNKGFTFVILDQQGSFQEAIENLIAEPLHIEEFTQIIDTAYFGKSHHSKLIQITDLIAGILRFHLTARHKDTPSTYFHERVAKLSEELKVGAVKTECFSGDNKPLAQFYKAIEIRD